MSQSTNITWHDSEVTKEDRQRQMIIKVLSFGLQVYLVLVSQQSLWHLKRLYLKKANIHID